MTYRRGLQSNLHRENEDKEGHVYYVRLKTPLGFLYKLGFTSMPSVKERFAFQNKGHEEQIDFQYAFMKSKNALSIEQTLHSHFEHKAAFPIPEEGMPFFGNGQSELYVEDILELDSEYKQEQADRVEAAIMEVRMRRMGNSEAAIQEALKKWRKQRADLNALSAGTKKFAASWPVNWIIWCWTKIHDCLFTAPRAAERTTYIEQLKGDLRAHKRHYIHQQTIEILEILKKEKVARDMSAALSAIKSRNLVNFERLVDMDRLVYNVAEAMTSNFFMGSDYLGVPNNLNLMDLLGRMFKGNPRDVLLEPVQDSYKVLLRYWILHHELLSDQLTLPPDPIYHVEDDGTTHEVSQLSSVYFGPAVYLSKLGRNWSLPEAVNRSGDDWAEFDISVQNPITGFYGTLVVRATAMKESEQIELDFRNFPDLYRQALTQFTAHERAYNPDAPDPLEGLCNGTQIRPGEALKRALRYPDLAG